MDITAIQNKKTIIYAVLGLILVFILFWFLFSRVRTARSPADVGQSAAPAVPTTVLPVPKNVSVPNVDSNVSGVGKPVSVVSAGGTTGIDKRSFNIVADKNLVSPETIAVYVNDIITLNFSAADKDYDFTQPDNGLSWTVKKGGSKSFQFQGLNAGKFVYYCVSCGGPRSGPVGYIIVAPR